MKRFRRAWPVLLAAMATSVTAVGQTPDIQPVVAGNNAFALDLYARLRADQGNLFFSPYSISICLAMTGAGARGDTEKQMAQTLHLPVNAAELHPAFGQLQTQLRALPAEMELDIANGLWGQSGHPFLPEFLDLASRDYEADLKQVDFRADAEAARKQINDWVRDKTKNKINDLIPSGTLTAATRLVLANAIYFKGKWAQPFNASGTTNAPFSIARGQTIQASLMNVTGDFKYTDIGGLQLLELPYLGGGGQSKAAPQPTGSNAASALSMIILLPREMDALKPVETSLDWPKLNAWLSAMRVQKVNVFLPRFKFTREFALAGTLEQMGMTDAFSTDADFSGMDGARDLFLSAVVHKAQIEVNEEGTVAAAATGAVMALTSAIHRPPPTFRADHPFIFLIRENHSGSILFMGRVADPTK